MINDILFEKFQFPVGVGWDTKLTPPSSNWLRTSEAKAALAQGGNIAKHVFTTSNQPLSASDVTYLRDLENRANGRPVLVQNPFHNSVTHCGTVNEFGSLSGGCIVRPRGSILWQPCLFFTTLSLEKLILRPVAYAENILVNGTTALNFDFVTKSSNSLAVPTITNTDSEVELASFDFWLAMKITQLEINPIRNERTLNLSSTEQDYVATITLEEDVERTLPVIFSWASLENVKKTVGGGTIS
jgi:hypothetical protein